VQTVVLTRSTIRHSVIDLSGEATVVIVIGYFLVTEEEPKVLIAQLSSKPIARGELQNLTRACSDTARREVLSSRVGIVHEKRLDGEVVY
jgi:hypothetical protein